MTEPRPSPLAPTRIDPRRGFTITELLVVIGIIVLLIGILLPALSKVNERAKKTQTSAIMEEFAKGCEAFRQEFGFYPGLVPEDILAADPKISGTENALLHLMGGGVSQDDPAYDSLDAGGGWQTITFGSGNNQYRIKVNPSQIGKGPRVGGKSYAPFFSPKTEELAQVDGQIGRNGEVESKDTALGDRLPDLVDAWGQPILYLRAVRSVGNLVGEAGGSSAPRTQFVLDPILPYLNSDSLGELGKPQGDSIIRLANGNNRSRTVAQIIRHPGLGNPTLPENGTAKGQVVVISAGKDGVYFSRYDGPGSPAAPVTNILNGTYGKPQVVEQYDDIIVFGGG